MRVLLVDDTPEVAATISEYLRSADFGEPCRVDTAPNRARAVTLFRSAARTDEPFDCAIVDMELPVARNRWSRTEGVNVAKAIRALDEDIYSIVITAHTEDPDIRGEIDGNKDLFFAIRLKGQDVSAESAVLQLQGFELVIRRAAQFRRMRKTLRAHGLPC